MLTLYRRTVVGVMTFEMLLDIMVVSAAEFLIVGVLSIGTLVLGVVPQLAFDLTHQSTADILGMIGQETAP
jgi:NADH-quinone oxidoreductase subunit M